MKRSILRLFGLAALIVLIASSRAHAGARVFLQIGPPAPLAVVAPVAPAPYGYVWQPGYYAWGGAAYRWVPGVWSRPPFSRAAWVAPRWGYGPRGWSFARGYWRRR
jgi:WXXGXW repeat (2 copies)